MDGNGNNLFQTQHLFFNCYNNNKNNQSNATINEDDEVLIKEILKELREEISIDEEVSKINFQDDFLLRFLYSRQLDIKKAKSAIKNYLNAKKTETEMFQLPYKLQEPFNSNVIGILNEKNTKNKETILITKPGNWDPNSYDFDTLTAATVTTLEVASFDFDTQIHGIIDIIDMTGFGWKQLKHYGPFQGKKTADVIEKIMPIRFNEIHIINESYLARMAYTLVKNFLSDDFTKKIHFHGSDLSKLHKIVDPNILPKDIGGKKEETFSSKIWYEKLMQSEAALQALWNKYTC